MGNENDLLKMFDESDDKTEVIEKILFDAIDNHPNPNEAADIIIAVLSSYLKQPARRQQSQRIVRAECALAYNV